MKILLTFFMTMLALSSSLLAAEMDVRLNNFINNASDEKIIKVILMMEEPKTDLTKPKRYRKQDVMVYLKSRTMVSYNLLKDTLNKSQHLNKNIVIKSPHWINNTITVTTNKTGLNYLKTLNLIKKIYPNGKISYEQPVKSSSATRIEGEIPYDYNQIKLTDLMKELPDVTGKGVVLGSVDTGVDGKHPALAGKVIRFLNGETKAPSDPKDFDEHGTHTVGTMVGGDRTSNFIGMAPDAKVVAAGVLSDYDTMLFGMEWMLDPDKDPQTKDSPRAINNSWNCEGAPDVELFYKAIEAWEAAGVLPVFSAGNQGPSPSSITKPHEHPLTQAVAATGANGKVTDFSSRGPGVYHGGKTEKPDVAAPGDKIYSAVPGGKYAKMSGTSMAAPHQTGVVALVLQVAPEFNPAQIRALFMQTATQVGRAEAWNAEYGHGIINVLSAVKSAKAYHMRNRSLFEAKVNGTILDMYIDPISDIRLNVIKALSNVGYYNP